jgi:hypothetical protein
MAGRGGSLHDKWSLKSHGITFMSPQPLKERIKHRCMEHMRKNRKRILDNLRNTLDVTSELKDVSESHALEDLLHSGKLSHDDYLEILTSVESALRDEMNSEELDHAEGLLAAEEAWISDFDGMDIDGRKASEFVLCPICKKHGLSESLDVCVFQRRRSVQCQCGFSLEIDLDSDMSVLLGFQEALSNAFESHRFDVMHF